MGYFDEEYDYTTLANDADYIDYDDDEYNYDEFIDDGIEAWENYYHNIASEIDDDEQPSLQVAHYGGTYYFFLSYLVSSNLTATFMNVLDQTLDDYRRTDDGKIIQGASHTSRILNHKYRNRVIIDAYTKLQKVDFWFDAIACCGTSGMLVVPQIAELLKKNIIVIRKNTDNGYSDFLIEGPHTNQYVIIDDLICSGSTVKRIINTIKEDSSRSKCMGIYSYMKDECAYRNRPDLCMRDLRIPYLNC